MAADTAGNVYVADTGGNRILELSAGATTPTRLFFARVIPFVKGRCFGLLTLKIETGYNGREAQGPAVKFSR